MSDPQYLILYVDDAPASAAFYGDLIGRTPVESSPVFALFVLASGVKLGLWSKHTVEPATTTTGGGCELAFPVDSEATVNELHDRWRDQGLPVLQTPTQMDFGYTFVAADPDGHRLRVFTPNA